MKHLKRLVLLLVSATLFICWNRPLPSRSHAPAASTVPPMEQIQGANPGGVHGMDAVAGDGRGDRLAQIAGDRLTTFLEADRLYRQGDVVAAEQLYRQVKPEFDTTATFDVPAPIYEAEALDPETLAHWNAAQVALEADEEEAAIQSLQMVVDNQPEFLPAPLKLAEMLEEEDQEEEAIAVLEQAATLYPNSAEIVMAQVLALSEEDEHLEASIAAREFALLNLDHPQAAEFEVLAEEEFKKFSRSRRRRGLLGGAMNIVGGILTGDRVPWESWDSVVETSEVIQLMLASESEFGAKIAEEYSQQLPLVEDPEVVDYVTQLGLEVAQRMGRDFEYEFYVVQDNSINAFALPGGKIFVNTGAILGANSQAELAGLLAHEAAHSVLSHGIQSFFRDDMLSQFADEVPLGELVTGLISLHYSRRQEQQSDILGNRVLATAGYAADGLRNLMATLNQIAPSNPIEYLSSHPAPASRVEYLEALIQRNGYNRYALEGVDRHLEIQSKL